MDETTGFRVDPQALDAYAGRADRIADDLRRLAEDTLGPMRELDGFGRIGRESGFTEALEGFADSITRRVRAVAVTTARLGATVAATADDYRRDDASAAESLTRAVR